MRMRIAATAASVFALAALAVPASANSAYSGLKFADADAVTASIEFEFSYSVDADDSLWAAQNAIPVTDAVELPAQDLYYGEEEWEYCTSPAVDIAADLSSITVTGTDDRCEVQVAYLDITLDGAEFGDVTVEADGLFTPAIQLQSGGGGNGALGNGLRFAEPTETPSLADLEVDGAEFAAYWVGSGLGFMSGVTEFSFGDDVDEAGPAVPVEGDPTFTG